MRLVRERSTSSAWNMMGVTTSEGSTSRADRRASTSASCSKVVTATSILRSEPWASRPCREPAAEAAAKVSSGEVMTGMLTSSPSRRRSAWGATSKPPLRTRPDRIGKLEEAWAAMREMSMAERSAGTMASCPAVRRSRTWETSMAHTRTDSASRSSSVSSPAMRVPSTASSTSRTTGAASSGTSGSVVEVMPSMAVSASPTAWRVSGRHLLATTATVRAWLSAISAMETSTEATTSSTSFCPETTSSTGTPMLAATRALRASSGLPATSVKSEPSMMTTSCSRAMAR